MIFKKIYLVILTIIFFIIVFLLFFFYKNSSASCLRKIEGLNDNQILKERFVDKNKHILKNDRVFDEYFMCKIGLEDEPFYKNRMTRYFTKSGIDENYYDYFNNLDSNFYGKNFNKIIAFDEVSMLGIERLHEYMKESAFVDRGKRDIEGTWLGTDTAEKVDLLLNDDKFFRENIINLKFTNIDEPVDGNVAKKDINDIRGWKISFAYRKGGLSLALEMCDGFYGLDYDYCKKYVESIVESLEEYQEKEVYCANLVNSFSSQVCN